MYDGYDIGFMSIIYSLHTLLLTPTLPLRRAEYHVTMLYIFVYQIC